MRLLTTIVILSATLLTGFAPCKAQDTKSPVPATESAGRQDKRLLDALASVDLSTVDLRLLAKGFFLKQAGFGIDVQDRAFQRIARAMEIAESRVGAKPTPPSEFTPEGTQQYYELLRLHYDYVAIEMAEEMPRATALFLSRDLTPAASLRVRQVWLQIMGPGPDILDVLGVASEKKADIIKALIAARKAAMKEKDDEPVFRAASRGVRKVMAELLTEPQKQLWQRLVGKEIEMSNPPAKPTGERTGPNP